MSIHSGRLSTFADSSRKVVAEGCKDVSQSGCFIETRASQDLRSAEVEIRFTLGRLKQSVLARVMDVRPGKGAGFEFLTADPHVGPGFSQHD
jgi:hypothetical protein